MKNISKMLVGVTALVGVISLGVTSIFAGDKAKTASADLMNLEGNSIGAATIIQSPHGLLVHIKVKDLPPGPKGVHFHKKADCAAETGFKSCLSQHGEGEGEHGLLNAAGPGKGDLGNIYIGKDGVGEMQFFKNGVFLDEGALPLLDDDGTAIVIHANEDDQVTQPIGGAGPRLVCGLVQAS